jgi:hypothetical protein
LSVDLVVVLGSKDEREADLHGTALDRALPDSVSNEKWLMETVFRRAAEAAR